MDPKKHSGDMFKHLEKQNDFLMDAYKSMSHELHRLQKNDNTNVACNNKNGQGVIDNGTNEE